MSRFAQNTDMLLNNSSVLQDSIKGRNVTLVMGAVSESLCERGEQGSGQQILRRARLQNASHCLIVDNIIYFSDCSGTSLAAQLESQLAQKSEFTDKRVICVPFDSLVYLCLFNNRIVTSERMLPPEQAVVELKKNIAPAAVILAGDLSPGFREWGEVVEIPLVFGGTRGNRYKFNRVSVALLFAGKPALGHMVIAAVSLSSFAVALAVGFYLPEQDGKQVGVAPPQLISQLRERSLSATAGSSLRTINEIAHQLAPLASLMSIEKLNVDKQKMRFESDGGEFPEGIEELSTQFRLIGWEGLKLAWEASLELSGREVEPVALPVLWDYATRLRDISGVGQLVLRPHIGLTSSAVDLEIKITSPLAPALEDLADALAALPAQLKQARVNFSNTGMPKEAELYILINIRSDYE